MADYDAIVLGTGAIGSATLWQLAKRGMKVLGLDRFDPPHEFGSSHGQSRIIRQAYFEHPDYTPLMLEAYRLWVDLEQLSGRRLYHEVGVLQIGPEHGEVVRGVLKSAGEHELQIETISARAIVERWPALRVPEELIGVFESRAGYLLVEDCVQALLDAAHEVGAERRTFVEVYSWHPGPPVTLKTSAGEISADRLIVTAGAWADNLLADLQLALKVYRKSTFWFPVQPASDQQFAKLPCFLYELPTGVFYGMPPIDELGVKIAEHSGGQVVLDPMNVDRQVDPIESQKITEFLEQHLPQISPQRNEHKACLYTMSADGHFIVDRHPEHPQVVFAAGLSGHGFKFAPVLGKALADLSLTGKTELPIRFLGLR